MNKVSFFLLLLFSVFSNSQNNGKTQYGENDTIVYRNPQVEAEFSNISEKIPTYITKQIINSDAYLDNSISGKFYISFIVEKDGSLNKIEVLGGNDFEKNVILGIIQKIPKLLSAEHEGYHVRSSISFPIIIKKNNE